MENSQVSAGLVQTWVSVVDSVGRTHLEARWTTPEMAAALHSTHAA
ncbi:MAG: hypothetical protein F2667_12720 [Actinobacteria bacterium]|uniref:Unannotated protein n=1 Tax=freshwater metagenome TaxID=449393 RepID=A0A6J6S0T4_9ZZZZ|nr:hypothetical protein [Actinomycetota bacterium]